MLLVVPCAPQSNPFARPLLEALQECGAASGGHLMHATFDSAIFVIRREMVAAFCEEMKAIVSAYREGARPDGGGGGPGLRL